MLKRSIVIAILIYISYFKSLYAEYRTPEPQQVLTTAVKAGGKIVIGVGLNPEIPNTPLGRAALVTTGVVITSGGVAAEAAEESYKTGRPFDETFAKRGLEEAAGFGGKRIAKEAASALGGNYIQNTAAEQLGDKLGREGADVVTDIFNKKNAGQNNIGGLQAPIVEGGLNNGESGIIQYDLFPEKGEISKKEPDFARDVDRDRRKQAYTDQNYNDNRYGVDSGYNDNYRKSDRPRKRRENTYVEPRSGRCGPGMHAPDYSTPNPQSCF